MKNGERAFMFAGEVGNFRVADDPDTEGSTMCFAEGDPYLWLRCRGNIPLRGVEGMTPSDTETLVYSCASSIHSSAN